jgi:hypothetical protein
MLFPQEDVSNFQLPQNYYGCIYQILNIETKKSYIGKTTNEDPIKYIEGHFKSAYRKKKNKETGEEKEDNKYFYRSIRKYGKTKFKCKILGYIFINENSESQLNEAEIACIYHFRAYGSDGENLDSIYGYNLTKGGDGVLGLKFSEKSIQKMSNSHLGQIVWNKGLTKETDERLFQMSINFKNNPNAGMKNKKNSKESNLKRSISHKGKQTWNKNLTKETDERLVKMGENVSKALKNKPKSKEHAEKVRQANLGKIKGKWMRKDEISEIVHFEDIQNYLNNGWVLGRGSINKGNSACAWQKGYTKETHEGVRKNSEFHKNLKWVKNETTCKQVNLENLQLYLDNGWVLGKYHKKAA